MDAVLPLAKEYGAAVIGLCMDDNGIPSTPQERVTVAKKIIERAAKKGISIEDIVIDPLAMTMSADHNAGLVALETVKLVVSEFGVNITMGASNISFSLPDRKHVNAAFIAMAILTGLTCPITNPLVTKISTAILAADLSLRIDEFSMRWIQAYRERQFSN